MVVGSGELRVPWVPRDSGPAGGVTDTSRVLSRRQQEEMAEEEQADRAKEGGVVEEKEERYRVTKITARRGWAIDQIKFEYR